MVISFAVRLSAAMRFQNLTFVRRRIFDALIVVWLVATLSFVLLHLAPGDPVSAVLTDPRIAPAVRAQWRAQNALDQPIAAQYVQYVSLLLRGNLGYSFSQYRPVANALGETLPYSLLLMGTALVASVLSGIMLGMYQAMRAGSFSDRGIATLMTVISAVPEVWMSLMLLALLGAQFSLFPLGGRCSAALCGTTTGWRAVLDVAYHAALPVITLTLLLTPMFARIERVTLLGVVNDDIMRSARAKGVRKRDLLLHHGLRRTARPLTNTVALSLPMLVGGAIFVERVFGWPGMGSLLVGAIGVRDYPLVTATAVIGCLFVVAGNLLADIVSALLDPRSPELTA